MSLAKWLECYSITKFDSIASTTINSFQPSDIIPQQWFGSILAQVRACCMTAPSHYPNQCWLIISEVQWHIIMLSNNAKLLPRVLWICVKCTYVVSIPLSLPIGWLLFTIWHCTVLVILDFSKVRYAHPHPTQKWRSMQLSTKTIIFNIKSKFIGDLFIQYIHHMQKVT